MMKKTVIAFDVDGTLIQNGAISKWDMQPNLNIVRLLKTLARFKNVEIVVWSAGGKQWADDAVEVLDIKKYVKATHAKEITGHDENGHPIIKATFKPDIAIDDIHSCDLGLINLIVREK